MQQQNLGYVPQSNQQYMQQLDQQTSATMQQNYQQQYQPGTINQVNQQSYLLPSQSINSHPLYAQQYQMQQSPHANKVYQQPYQRQQQQFNAYQYPTQSQWNQSLPYQPQMQIPHASSFNQNLPSNASEFLPPGLSQQHFHPSEPYKKNQFYSNKDSSNDLPTNLGNSPPTLAEESGGGYFLPDFITNELEGQSPPAHLATQMFKQSHQKTSSLIGDELEQQLPTDSKKEKVSMFTSKKMCDICNSEIHPSEQVIEGIQDKGKGPYYTHINCYTNHSQASLHDQEDPRLAPQPLIRGLSSGISPQQKPLISVQLTPDMLQFDFQLLHPLTQTNIFSLSNQSANYIFDQQNSSFLYNKLLCNATAIPFNVAVVKLKWDFFRDPAQMVDPYSLQNPLLPTLPQCQYSNMIQGLINFNEIQALNDKNITITLKAQPQDPSFLGSQQSNPSMLHLNFNYSNFQDQSFDPHAMPQKFMPVAHIIKNLYMSFILSSKDYEILKEDTMKVLQANPSLVPLLKPSQGSIQNQFRFVSTQPGNSLHQLYQGASESMYQPLTTQMQQMNLNQNQMLSPPTNQMQPSYNSPHNANNKSSPKGHQTFTAKLENQGSERKLQIEQLQTNKLQRRMPSDNIRIPEEFKRTRNQRKDTHDYEGYDEQESPGEENQSFRKALTMNLEVSTFEGENQKQIRENKQTGNDLSQSVGGSPKQDFRDTSPTFLSTGGDSSRHLFGHEKEESGDFLNPQALKKQRTHKVSSKKGDDRKGSQGSFTSKKSKKSTSSVRSGGSSSKSASSARQEELDSENAQIISELKGKIVENARSQHGSKYLQKLLARASPDFVGFAIDESIYHLHELMVDQYGNYFCQKLLQSSSSAQRNKILQVLSPNILKISCDRKGTHSMQCLIEMINMPEEEEALKNGIKNHVIDLAFNANGTHVLQKVMLCMKEENIDFIFDPVFENLIDLSMDQNGLCVIKKIISKIQGHEKRMKIGQRLSEHVVELVQSPYGNYAVQQALDNWPIQYCESIFEKLEPHLMQLSVQKFSSNVIEKVLENATYDTVERYMKVLCEHEVMKSLIKNTYGFYVLQKLKEVVRRHGRSCKRIYQAIENTIQYVSDKSLKQKWQQLMSQS